MFLYKIRASIRIHYARFYRSFQAPFVPHLIMRFCPPEGDFNCSSFFYMHRLLNKLPNQYTQISVHLNGFTANGKTIGNQLTILGVCVSGFILKFTPLYRTVSKKPANAVKTQACLLLKVNFLYRSLLIFSDQFG